MSTCCDLSILLPVCLLFYQQDFAEYFLNSILWFLAQTFCVCVFGGWVGGVLSADSSTQPVPTSYDPSYHRCCTPDILALPSYLPYPLSLWSHIHCCHNGSFRRSNLCAYHHALASLLMLSPVFKSPSVHFLLFLPLFSQSCPFALPHSCVFATLTLNAPPF